MTEQTRNPTTFYDGKFNLGTPCERTVMERDYPTEYSLLAYLALATEGQQVGVGTLHCPIPMTREEYERAYPGLSWRPRTAEWIYQVPLVVLPDVGIWVCQTVWHSADEARELAVADLAALAQKLERDPDELPLNLALISVLPEQHPSLRGIDPVHYYDTSFFGDVAGQLTRRAPPVPDGLDDLIGELLGVGTWLDAKTDVWWDDALGVPRWLADLIGLDVVG